jgi:imidazolonepropionase-like amidohydrolase
MLRICIVFFIALLFHYKAVSQGAEKATSNKRIAVKAARLLDVRTGQITLDPIVLIKEGRVQAISTGSIIPKDFHLVDLGDVTLLPGLIDCHTHLLHNYDDHNPNALNETSRQNIASRALRSTSFAKEMLEAGFTTVRDLGNSGLGGDVALRDAINFGWVIGPRMVVSTRAIAPIGGQFGYVTARALDLVKEEYIEINGIEEAKQAVRQAIYDGANCIKVIANSGALSLSYEELKAIVDEAQRLGVKVAAHATGGPAVMSCIKAGVNSIEHGYDLSDLELKMMAKMKIFLVPTDEPNIADQQKRLARAVKAGVQVAAGSDVYTAAKDSRGKRSLRVLEAYVMAGMSPIEAIQTATINAGELLGFSEFIGSAIEVGKPADIIAVQGELLADIKMLSNIGFVMKEGKIYVDRYSVH